MQLVDECVSVYDGMKERLYDGKGVLEKFAVHPQQIADYLALVGDTSDNIAGVQKVGAKTAAKWLMQYESLDNIIRCADEIKGKVGENLRTAIADGTLAMARRLVAVRDDVPIDENMTWIRKRPIYNNGMSCATNMNFANWPGPCKAWKTHRQKHRRKPSRHGQNMNALMTCKNCAAWQCWRKKTASSP